MRIADADIRETVRVSAALRPLRSPIRPSSQPPTGRMKNPTAKMPMVFMRFAVSFPFGKNASAKYTAKVAYTNQSNHSTML